MTTSEKPDDYVIATGETNSLEQFVEETFQLVGLDWREHVEIDPNLFRPTELKVSRADPTKARDVLGWCATYRMRDVVRLMVQAAQEALSRHARLDLGGS
jgi:GDPmannose 4,6-dehydratase